MTMNERLTDVARLIRKGAGADWCDADHLIQQLEADARALWAVRVLDAHADKHSIAAWRTDKSRDKSVKDEPWLCYSPAMPTSTWRRGKTHNAARIAAADALVAAHPELDQEKQP